MDKETALYLMSRGVRHNELYLYEVDEDSYRFMGVPGGIAEEFLSPQHPVNNDDVPLDADGVPESKQSDADMLHFARELQADAARRQRMLEQNARDAMQNEDDIMTVAHNMAVKEGKLQPEEDLSALELSDRMRYITRAASMIGYHADADADDGSSGRLPGWIGNYPVH